LKPLRSTPRSSRYLPAGLSTAIAPAGEIWSVVIESPKIARMRAPETGSSCLLLSRLKYGGLRI